MVFRCTGAEMAKKNNIILVNQIEKDEREAKDLCNERLKTFL